MTSTPTGSVATLATLPVSTVSSVASGRTGVSTITTDVSRVPVSRIENPAAPDATFTSITVRPGGARPILRDHRPPNNEDAGHQLCFAWWLRGGCFQTVEGVQPMCHSRMPANAIAYSCSVATT